jgi:hypothetical protein
LVPDVAAPIVESAGPREVTESPSDATATDDSTRLAVRDEAARVAAGEGPPTLIVVSLILLLAGIGLFVARWGAGRLRGA